MTTWIVGDIHGCASELEALIGYLALSEDDTLVSCGDLFHRGPDPVGVMELLKESKAKFILGNHERTVLKRVGLDPHHIDASDRPPLREQFPPIDASDLAGDGSQPCLNTEGRREELLVFLQSHSGYFLRNRDLEQAGPTHDGRDWCVVHAGLDPSKALTDHSPFELTRMRRLDRRGQPWWYDRYKGTDLILYGHTSNKIPKATHVAGRMATLGLDTACVYGGALTAYSPELDQFLRVPAARDYTKRRLSA